MAHLTEGTLRRLVDDPHGATAADLRHLDGCSDCRARQAAVSQDGRLVAAMLAVPEAKVDVAAALSTVLSAPAARPRFGIRLPLVRTVSRPMMLGFAAALAALALLATVIAENGTVFAPSTVTAVPVTVADMQSLSQLSAYGDVLWTTQPQLQVVSSAADAESMTGLKAPVASNLPAGVSTTVTYGAMTKAVAVFTFDAAKAAAAAASSGKPLPALPAGMDGVKLTVTVGPAIGEGYVAPFPCTAGIHRAVVTLSEHVPPNPVVEFERIMAEQ